MSSIAKDLGKIDLNLLISLHILIEEQNVSRAAKRLHITQPAMSKTLSRLRTLFGDALFTRSSHGMQPTPRAIELSEGLRNILGDISSLLGDPSFEPSTCQDEITLAMSEYIGVALLPRLMKKVSNLAPGLDIRVITRVENQLEELALGNLDFAIHIKQSDYGPDFRIEDLGASPSAILVRETHPLTRGNVSWSSLKHFPLIRLYVSDREQSEVHQKATEVSLNGKHPHGTLEISHLLTALEVLRETDYFMPAPAYILQNAATTAGIVGLPMPAQGDLNINYALVAHRRTSGSALHGWLWEQISSTIAELRTPLTRKLRQRIPASGVISGLPVDA